MHQANASSTRRPQASLGLRGTGSAAKAGGDAESAAAFVEGPVRIGAVASEAAETGLRCAERLSASFSLAPGLDAAASRRGGAEAGEAVGRAAALAEASTGAAADAAG